MLKEIFKSFFYLLLLNNFMFKFFLGIELPLFMENSPKKIFKFSIFTTIIFTLTTLFSALLKKMILIPYNLENLFLIENSVVIIILVYLLGFIFTDIQKMKKHILLNVLFLSTFLYSDNVTVVSGIIFGLLNGIFIFVSFIFLSDLYERIETKAEYINPEFIYYLSISIISMIMFGFTGLDI